MGTITISLKDKVEKKFRKTARLVFGKKKGHLSKAITEAIEEWAKRKAKDTEKALELLEKGFEMGRLKFKTRAELHER